MSTQAFEPSVSAGRSTAPRTLLRSATRVRSGDEREFDVKAALALSTLPDDLEVYVGWPSEPIGVTLRRDAQAALKWETVAPLMQQRVLTAIAPLVSIGWRLDGAFPVAARWDMSHGEGGDLYEGCWVRLRR